MNRRRLRIFVSSPGDVSAARELTLQVIEKLAQDFIRFFVIEPYLWEYEPMLASGHFQDSIEPPSQFDAVILILESRLGTLLPERSALRTYHGMDGRAPVTGTEWEFEDALAVAREKGVPDILVYRSLRDARVNSWNQESRKQTFAQLEALEAFWTRHFTGNQEFRGAYSTFETLEQFTAQLESNLRSRVEQRISAIASADQSGAVRLWATSPFRGLEAYEFKHERIFFGRNGPIGEALLRLLQNSEAHKPFLLVVGASGSGKSSLVRAGILPKLLLPQRMPGAYFVRRATFRPSDCGPHEDLFMAFARRLTDVESEGAGLPELLGPSANLQGLVTHLREAIAHPELPFAMVLDQLAVEARERGRMRQFEQAKLILVVDQLEELFTLEQFKPAERARFMQLLAGCVRSERIWVICTMRADFWHHAAEIPDLLRLADGNGRLDLAAPTLAELSQMIRGPANVAALQFETDLKTGISLNDQLAQDASSEPGALPLLSFVLDQLYQQDIQRTDANVLTFATYAKLGGLKGAIATRAEEVLAAQAPDDQKALRQVLFALVQLGSSSEINARAVSRRAALVEFPEGTSKRRLVDAMTASTARLLVTDARPDATPTVSLAHEALISQWARARDYVEANREALRVRRAIEERFGRWERAIAANSGGSVTPSISRRLFRFTGLYGRDEAGLLGDLDLSDGTRLLKDYREELSDTLVDYIEKSIAVERRRARATMRFIATVAVVTSALAIAAVIAAGAAHRQSRIAQRESAVANDTVDFLEAVFRDANPEVNNGQPLTAQALLDQATRQIQAGGSRESEVRAKLLTVMGEAYGGLNSYATAEGLLKQALGLLKSDRLSAEDRVHTLIVYGSTLYLDSGYAAASKVLGQAVSEAKSSLPAGSLQRSLALVAQAEVETQEGHYKLAEKDCKEALEIDRRRGPEGAVVYATTLDALGHSYYASDQLQQAETTFRDSLRIVTAAVGPKNARAAQTLEDLGATLYQEGQYAHSIEIYEQALPVIRSIYTENHTETANVLNNIARSILMMGDPDRAYPMFEESMAIDQKLEVPTHDDFVSTLNSLGMIDAFRDNLKMAKDELERAESIADMDAHNELLDQVLLNEADLALTQGDRQRAADLLARSLVALKASHPDNQLNAWRYAVWNSVAAELTALNGDPASAQNKIAAAQATIRARFGDRGFYTQLAARRAKNVLGKS